MARRDQFVTVDGLELHYSEWGAAEDPTVLCLHGLSRVGRDFDPLARVLEEAYHVVCPDMPGRGWSQWVDDPGQAYTDAAMVERLVAFVTDLHLAPLRIVGTSMGGGLGMALAGGPIADHVTHLVVNDISPDPESEAVPAAMERIYEYVPTPPTVDTLAELAAYYRNLYEGRFSEMTDEEWRRLTVTSARRTGDGRIAPAYDPNILVEGDDPDAPDPWNVWTSIEADLMVVRGEDSDVLPPEPFERMQETQPDAEALLVDCGHAPVLNVPEQIEPIRTFLAE